MLFRDPSSICHRPKPSPPQRARLVKTAHDGEKKNDKKGHPRPRDRNTHFVADPHVWEIPTGVNAERERFIFLDSVDTVELGARNAGLHRGRAPGVELLGS